MKRLYFESTDTVEPLAVPVDTIKRMCDGSEEKVLCNGILTHMMRSVSGDTVSGDAVRPLITVMCQRISEGYRDDSVAADGMHVVSYTVEDGDAVFRYRKKTCRTVEE